MSPKTPEEPQKFEFTKEFAPDGEVLRDGDRLKRVFNEAELNARIEAAVAEALAAEEARAGEAQAQALRDVAGRMQAILGRLDAEAEAMRADAVGLALVAARRIAGAALEEFGAETVERCAADALADLRGEPRLNIRVHPSLAEAVSDKVAAEADRLGFDGAVVVRGDPETPSGDCVLEWRSGAVERTAADIETRIEHIVETWLASPRETGAGDDAPPPDVKEAAHG